jgi:hypothetical protein
MGYDMHLVERDNSLDEEHEAAKAAFHQAVRERDQHPRGSTEEKEAQERVDEAYERLSHSDLNYFRLNIWGMSTMRDDMERLGMLAYQYPMPRFPDPEDYGLTYEQLYEIDDEDRATHPDERVRKYHAASEGLLSFSPPDEPGLPVHKFGSNDGWHVTAKDCASALGKFREADPKLVEKVRENWRQDDGSSYFDEWIAFLERGARLNGFEVW